MKIGKNCSAKGQLDEILSLSNFLIKSFQINPIYLLFQVNNPKTQAFPGTFKNNF